jgi:hypothetical protein
LGGKTMTVKELKTILEGLPDDCEVEAHVVVDRFSFQFDEDVEIVNHCIEEFRFPDGKEKTTLILNCKEV